MHTQRNNGKRPSIAKKAALIGATMTALILLSGCLTSPYYGQIFNARTDLIPFEIWTYDKNQNITLECAQASAHGGPLNGGGSYQPLTTVNPPNQAHFDYKGDEIYHAGKQVVIPSSCWRYYPYSDGTNYITVVRINQGTLEQDSIYTFDKNGLGCLGEWVGKKGFYGWFGKGCEKRYTNTNNAIKTVFLKAKS